MFLFQGVLRTIGVSLLLPKTFPADKRGAAQNKWNTHDTVFFLFLDCFLVQRWVPRFEDPSRDEPKQALLTYFQLVEFW